MLWQIFLSSTRTATARGGEYLGQTLAKLTSGLEGTTMVKPGNFRKNGNYPGALTTSEGGPSKYGSLRYYICYRTCSTHEFDPVSHATKPSPSRRSRQLVSGLLVCESNSTDSIFQWTSAIHCIGHICIPSPLTMRDKVECVAHLSRIDLAPFPRVMLVRTY